eukprot:646836-Prymnesium_polylepis.1
MSRIVILISVCAATVRAADDSAAADIVQRLRADATLRAAVLASIADEDEALLSACATSAAVAAAARMRDASF